MKLSLFKATLLFALIFTTTAFGQEQGMSFNFFGSGARSEGMGQAYIAISNDATAGSWNPAGLYVHEKTMTNFSYSFYMPRGEYTFFQGGGLQSSFSHDRDFNMLNNFNFITPLYLGATKTVVTVGYSRNFNIYYKFGENLFSDWAGNDVNTVFERWGGIANINLGLGTMVWRGFSLGATVNIYTGEVVTQENKAYSREGTADFFGQEAVYEANVTVLDTTKYSGVNFLFGALYEAGRFRTGLTVRTPFNLKGESDSSFYWLATENGVALGENAAPFPMFVEDTAYVIDINSEIEIPMMIAFGLGYDFTDNLLLSGDIEYRGFKDKKVKNLVPDGKIIEPGGDQTLIFTDTLVAPKFSNILQFRIGGEYILNTSFGEIPIRAGFRNEAFPEGDIADYSINYTGPKGARGEANDSTRTYYLFDYKDNKVTGFSFALGTGLHMDNILLDFALTYSSYEQDIYRREYIDEDSFTETLRSKNEWNDYNLTISFTGYF